MLLRLLEYLVSFLADDPEGIQIDRIETPKVDLFFLRVQESDRGRILGRNGRTAEAIRDLMQTAAARLGKEAIIDIIE
ncbi:MAG: KH domain-containing protein [Candidatus Bipolaricaulia bacterium]